MSMNKKDIRVTLMQGRFVKYENVVEHTQDANGLSLTTEKVETGKDGEVTITLTKHWINGMAIMFWAEEK